jgi:hypothetical protein
MEPLSSSLLISGQDADQLIQAAGADLQIRLPDVNLLRFYNDRRY